MYGFFSIFLFYQRLHAKNFSGAWVAFGSLLSISAFTWLVFGSIFLIYWGYKISWVAAICIYAISFAFTIGSVVIERLFGFRHMMVSISCTGLIALPVLGYNMLSAIP